MATCTLSFPDEGGTSTFTASDSETTTVNAAGCTTGINFSNLNDGWDNGTIGETITFDVCAAVGETWFVGNVPVFATSSVGIGNQAGTGQTVSVTVEITSTPGFNSGTMSVFNAQTFVQVATINWSF